MTAEAPPPEVPERFDAAAALASALRRLTVLGGALLLIMGGFRAAFVLRYAHPEVWSDFLGDLPAAFAAGLLHDLRVVLLLLLPPMLSLLWLRGATRERWQKWLRLMFWWSYAGIAGVLTLLISDFIFYAFYTSHLSVLAYGFFEDDLIPVIVGAWKNHPFLIYTIVICIAAWILGRILLRLWSPQGLLRARSGPGQVVNPEPRLNVQLTLHVLATVVLLSWSFSSSTARLSADLPASGFVHRVPANGVESLAEAVWIRLTEEPLSVAARYSYAGQRERALTDFTGLPIQDDPRATALSQLPPQAMLPRAQITQQPHVVLVVMESFNTHLLRWQSEDFDLLGPLESFWERGWFFPRFLPSDNGSAGSILSLIVNLPYRPGTKQLSQSNLQTRSVPTSAARAFASQGYEPRFLYGGGLAWRKLEPFLPRQGFVETVGQPQIVHELGLDPDLDCGEWGVWDEHLYAAAEQRLRNATEPQFLILFTTTHHPPHELPAGARLPALRPPAALLERAGELDELQLMQLQTYQYACHELGMFLTRLEEQGLLEKTVVAATGDHTMGMGFPFPASEILLERAVPFFLLAPDPIAAQFTPELLRPGSHKDVIPTLLHLSGARPAEYRGIGTSMLDTAAIPYGYNADSLLIGRAAVVLEVQGGHETLAWRGDGVELMPAAETQEHRDLLRRHRAGLALTDWILWESSRASRP
jgi:phosphoglycerol transferase MdoB-like AlkP superfamily enzyme